MADPTFEKQLTRSGAVKVKLGTERMGGYVCNKVKFTIKSHSPNAHSGSQAMTASEVTVTQWVAQKFNYPISMVTESGGHAMIIECKNINDGKLSNSLFEIPSGYKKAASMAPPTGAHHPSVMPPNK